MFYVPNNPVVNDLLMTLSIAHSHEGYISALEQWANEIVDDYPEEMLVVDELVLECVLNQFSSFKSPGDEYSGNSIRSRLNEQTDKYESYIAISSDAQNAKACVAINADWELVAIADRLPDDSAVKEGYHWLSLDHQSYFEFAPNVKRYPITKDIPSEYERLSTRLSSSYLSETIENHKQLLCEQACAEQQSTIKEVLSLTREQILENLSKIASSGFDRVDHAMAAATLLKSTQELLIAADPRFSLVKYNNGWNAPNNSVVEAEISDSMTGGGFKFSVERQTNRISNSFNVQMLTWNSDKQHSHCKGIIEVQEPSTYYDIVHRMLEAKESQINLSNDISQTVLKTKYALNNLNALAKHSVQIPAHWLTHKMSNDDTHYIIPDSNSSCKEIWNKNINTPELMNYVAKQMITTNPESAGETLTLRLVHTAEFGGDHQEYIASQYVKDALSQWPSILNETSETVGKIVGDAIEGLRLWEPDIANTSHLWGTYSAASHEYGKWLSSRLTVQMSELLDDDIADEVSSEQEPDIRNSLSI